MGNIHQINAYQLGSSKTKQAITVLTAPFGNGWVVQAQFPKKAPTEDRTKILKWMMSYRQQLKSQHQLWDVSFRGGEDYYWLFITPANNDADLRRLAREKANTLFSEIVSSYAG